MSDHSCQSAHYSNKLKYEIDSWDLDQALKAKENIIVIDTRSADAYQKEHIPGAFSFPHRAMTQESTQEKLNKNTLYVTYCDGIGCNASTKGALKLSELGYKVKELMGGIEWWKRDGYPVATKNASYAQCQTECGCEG